MKEIRINIPEYDNCIELVWEKDFKIKTRYEYNTIIIEANKAGLVSLARHLLVLAQEDAPIGSHIHLDSLNSLEDDSVELILDKNDNL